MKNRSKQNHEGPLVTILATSNLSKLAVAKSLLESEGIRFHIKGEGLQSLFGLGGLTPVNPITGPIEVQVASGDAKRSLEVLRDVIDAETE
jgi:hypothetical protein